MRAALLSILLILCTFYAVTADPKESESVRDLIELLKRIKESDHKESERLIAKERETDQDDETFHNRGSENSAKEIQNRENRGNELTEEQKRGLLDSIFSFFQSTEEDDDDGFFNGLIKTATNFLDGISGEITFSSIASALGLPTFGSMPSPSRPAWKHSDFSSGSGSCSPSSIRGTPFRNVATSKDDLPILPNCGTRKMSTRFLELIRDERIVGGKKSRMGEWPWLAAIGPKDRGQICGATLINELWVLTAAHCFSKTYREPVCNWNVRLGEHDLLKHEGKHMDITPSKIIIHPNYDPKTNANDIALIKLSKRARLSQNEVNVACLPARSSDIDGSTCVVSGWGAIGSGGPASAYVQHVEVPMLPDSVCKKSYRTAIRPGMMCAGHVEGRRDSCQGDSGGPLVCKHRTSGKYLIAGVVSWGNSCAMKGFPGVYTKVTDYINWIEHVAYTN